MDVKKSKKADLEQKRGMFLQIGFIMAMGAALVAFEWTTSQNELGVLADDYADMGMEELPPLVRIKEPEMKTPLPKQIPITQIVIVEDDVYVEDDLDFSTDSDEDLDVLLDLSLGEEDDGDPIPFFALQNKPEFPGGERALLQYLSSSVRYPVIAQENGVQGVVYLSFVIGKDGRVSDVSVVRGVDPSIDKEAMRVVSGMPDWKPGKQGTKTVAVSYQVPMRFKLQ